MPGIDGHSRSSSNSSDDKRHGFAISKPDMPEVHKGGFVSSSDSSEEARRLGYVKANVPLPEGNAPDLSKKPAIGIPALNLPGKPSLNL